MGNTYIEIPISDEDLDLITKKRHEDGIDMYMGNYIGTLLAEYLKEDHPDEGRDRYPRRVSAPESVIFEKVLGNEISVYQGDLPSLQRAEIRWKSDPVAPLPLTPVRYFISLSDIAEQLGGPEEDVITVFDNRPVSGLIFQYGKEGKNWCVIGRHCGQV